MSEWEFKGISAHTDHLVPWDIIKKWYFVIVEEQWQSVIIVDERIKRGRVRAEPSDPKRTKGPFRCMELTNRSIHPPSFVRREGCHTSLGFNCRSTLMEKWQPVAMLIRVLTKNTVYLNWNQLIYFISNEVVKKCWKKVFFLGFYQRKCWWMGFSKRLHSKTILLTFSSPKVTMSPKITMASHFVT